MKIIWITINWIAVKLYAMYMSSWDDDDDDDDACVDLIIRLVPDRNLWCSHIYGIFLVWFWLYIGF